MSVRERQRALLGHVQRSPIKGIFSIGLADQVIMAVRHGLGRSINITIDDLQLSELFHAT